MNKTAYERVADAMHGVDDTFRDTLVYPDTTTVLGISEADNLLVLTAHSNDSGETQQVWIALEDTGTVEALQEALSRCLARQKLYVRESE